MKIRQRFSLAENTQHKDVISIIAVGALVLMLGGLAACGQGGQDEGDQQQNQSSQMQGQTQDQASRRNQQKEGQQRPAQSMRYGD